MSYVVGVDIGGTFTDCVVTDDAGGVTIGKAPSTPPDFHTGFVDSLRSAAARMGVPLDRLVSDAQGIYHGCTVGTNALVEGRTAKVGLLTTRGHRDVLFAMQAGGRLVGMPPEYVAHVAAQTKDPPLVTKDLVGEIDERTTFDGNALVELNEDTAREEIQRLLDAGVEAFAVSLLWSIINPAHELRLRELIKERAPGIFVSLSSEVIPRSGEYERTVATVVNSLIGPAMSAYLTELERELEGIGYNGTVQIMTCSGGVIDSGYARALPVLTIGSGPVAGLIGARTLSREPATNGNGTVAHGRDVITADMGGTTLDVGVIRAGEPLSRASTRFGQYEYFVPTLDVRSVGAGGGSIIHFDPDTGTLRVGPKSAGARPGPAAYLRGGTDATITDADLVLGYLNPDFFLGGEISLGLDAALEALTRAGDPLGFGPEETAAAAARIVDSQMADAIRLASVQQGYDPRRFVMYAYGGGGPVHVTALARELGIETVIVPLSDLAAGWSAFGVASSEAVVVEEAPRTLPYPFDADALNEVWAGLDETALSRMEAQGISSDQIGWERFADIRYSLQVNQVPVKAPLGHYGEEEVATLGNTFEQEYERLFGQGSGYADAGLLVTALRVRARARISDFQISPRANGDAPEEPRQKGTRGVIWYERGLDREVTPIYDGDGFHPGMEVAGPAIVEFTDTTLVIRHGQRAQVDRLGSVVLSI
jgi:N-methylhydantoinase A